MKHVKYIIYFFYFLLSANATAGLDVAFEADSKIDKLKTAIGKALGQGRSFALVIGISEYDNSTGNGFKSLQTAKGDVEKVKRFLIDSAGFEYVHVLTDDKVTRARIDTLMVDFFPGRLKQNDRFLLYWSGHGVARQLSSGRREGYLPLSNSRKDMFSSMVSMDDVRRWDNLLDAKQTLFILDACLSGLAGQQAKQDINSLTVEQLNRPSHHLFVAGTSDESTIAGDRWGGSIFTEALIRGGSGAADSGGSGIVSLSDLLTYVRRYVAIEKDRAAWSKSLTPQLRDLRASDGEFYFQTGGKSREQFTPSSSTAKPIDIKSSESDISAPNTPELQRWLEEDFANIFSNAKLQPDYNLIRRLIQSINTPDQRRTRSAKQEDNDIEAVGKKLIEKLNENEAVNITSYNKLVLITGETPTISEKEKVTEIISNIPGVRLVQNELSLRSDRVINSQINDSEIHRRIRLRLADTDISIPQSSISIVVRHGTVYLKGLVTQPEKETIVGVTRTTAGVEKVVVLFEMTTNKQLVEIYHHNTTLSK